MDDFKDLNKEEANSEASEKKLRDIISDMQDAHYDKETVCASTAIFNSIIENLAPEKREGTIVAQFKLWFHKIERSINNNQEVADFLEWHLPRLIEMLIANNSADIKEMLRQNPNVRFSAQRQEERKKEKLKKIMGRIARPIT